MKAILTKYGTDWGLIAKRSLPGIDDQKTRARSEDGPYLTSSRPEYEPKFKTCSSVSITVTYKWQRLENGTPRGLPLETKQRFTCEKTGGTWLCNAPKGNQSSPAGKP